MFLAVAIAAHPEAEIVQQAIIEMVLRRDPLVQRRWLTEHSAKCLATHNRSVVGSSPTGPTPFSLLGKPH